MLLLCHTDTVVSSNYSTFSLTQGPLADSKININNMETTYNKKLMFHRPAEKHSFCKQLTGRVAGEKKWWKKILTSCGSSLDLSNSRYQKNEIYILATNPASKYESTEAIYISTRKLADCKLLYVGRDSSELKPPLTSSFRDRSSQNTFLAYAAI